MDTQEPAVRSGTWLEEELQRALERIEGLTHELARVQAEFGSQRAEVARLQEAMAVVEGRTQRHETGQDAWRGLQQSAEALSERVDLEAAQRRDIAAAVERRSERERGEQQDLHLQLEEMKMRLSEIEERRASEDDRQRRATADLAGRGRRDETLDDRLAHVERQSAADREALRRAQEEIVRLASPLTGLRAAIDELETSAHAMQEDQRRVDENLAAVRSQSEREDELLEVIDQQRAARQRMEERLSALDEAVEEARERLAEAQEERLLLRQQASGNHQRQREFGELLEAQRDAITEYFRRVNDANAAAGRGQAEEIERAHRIARDLLVQFSERSDEVGREQPL